jgi:hypothetical protein
MRLVPHFFEILTTPDRWRTKRQGLKRQLAITGAGKGWQSVATRGSPLADVAGTEAGCGN